MSGPWHPTGRGRVSQSKPNALAVCDRCSFTYNHSDLRWQYEWSGVKLQNIRLLVCNTCLDKPQPELKTIIIPPDPLPVFNARPEQYSAEVQNNISTEDGNPIATEGGDNLIWEDQTTPLPDPNNPALYPP